MSGLNICRILSMLRVWIKQREHITELLEMKDCRFDNTPLQPYFNKLSQILREYGEIDNCAKNKKFKQHIKLDNA